MPYLVVHADDGTAKYLVEYLPVVKHGLAELSSEMQGHSSASALKAMALHCATREGEATEVGYGRFQNNYQEILDHDPNRVSVLYDLTINRTEVLGLSLPMPGGEINGMIDLWYTVAFMCPCEPTESVEYTKAGVGVVFRPHAGMYSFMDPNDEKYSVKVDIMADPQRAQELSNQGWKQSGNPVSRSANSTKIPEMEQREGGKWETSMRWHDRMRASGLFNPRLDVRYLAREGGELSHFDESISVAVVATIVARAGIDLFTPTRVTFPQMDVLAPRIPVRVQT